MVWCCVVLVNQERRYRVTCPSKGINGGASSVEALAFFPTATFSPPVVFFPTGEEVFWGAVFGRIVWMGEIFWRFFSMEKWRRRRRMERWYGGVMIVVAALKKRRRRRIVSLWFLPCNHRPKRAGTRGRCCCDPKSCPVPVEMSEESTDVGGGNGGEQSRP